MGIAGRIRRGLLTIASDPRSRKNRRTGSKNRREFQSPADSKAHKIEGNKIKPGAGLDAWSRNQFNASHEPPHTSTGTRNTQEGKVNDRRKEERRKVNSPAGRVKRGLSLIWSEVRGSNPRRVLQKRRSGEVRRPDAAIVTSSGKLAAIRRNVGSKTAKPAISTEGRDQLGANRRAKARRRTDKN